MFLNFEFIFNFQIYFFNILNLKKNNKNLNLIMNFPKFSPAVQKMEEI